MDRDRDILRSQYVDGINVAVVLMGSIFIGLIAGIVLFTL